MSTITREAATIPIGYEDVLAAADRLAPWVHRTPVLTSRTLDDRSGGTVFLKCENLQKVGAFKFRGAVNARPCSSATTRRRAGVVTHSSGNHAQALALAGKLLGVPVTVVMPRTAPAVKRQATEGYGARVVPCEPTLADREATVAAEIERHGLTLVHPFNDWNVIAGQGTAALSCSTRPALSTWSSARSAAAGCSPAPRWRLAGPRRGPRSSAPSPSAADDARRSLETGTIQPSHDPKTIADGLRTSLGPRDFAVISGHVDRIVTASEPEIIEAMRFIWERVKIVLEPSSAVAVAPLWNGQLDVRGLRVGVILSGGNVDLEPMFQALAAKFL